MYDWQVCWFTSASHAEGKLEYAIARLLLHVPDLLYNISERASFLYFRPYEDFAYRLQSETTTKSLHP